MHTFLSAWGTQHQRLRRQWEYLCQCISPQTMAALGIETSQLEPVPQLSVGTAAAGKKMRVLGQAPRLELHFGQHPAKFRIRTLVLQGMVHPLNLCGPFLRRVGIDQLHSRGTLRIHGKEVPMCTPRGVKSLPPSPEVFTLQVTAPVARSQQYQTHGPSLEARSGPTIQRVEGKTPSCSPHTGRTLSSSWNPSAYPAHRAVLPGGQPNPARSSSRREPVCDGRQFGMRGCGPEAGDPCGICPSGHHHACCTSLGQLPSPGGCHAC